MRDSWVEQHQSQKMGPRQLMGYSPKVGLNPPYGNYTTTVLITGTNMVIGFEAARQLTGLAHTGSRCSSPTGWSEETFCPSSTCGSSTH